MAKTKVKKRVKAAKRDTGTSVDEAVPKLEQLVSRLEAIYDGVNNFNSTDEHAMDHAQDFKFDLLRAAITILETVIVDSGGYNS